MLSNDYGIPFFGHAGIINQNIQFFKVLIANFMQ